jgi:D-cysteine desulfhydrase
VVCAVGSGASYAGLLAGAGELQWAWPVLGASVSRPLAEISATLCTLVEQASALLAGTRPAPAHLIDALGAGHGVAGDDEVELAGLALRTEGLLLDPTYTAKSFALAVRTAREQAGPVVFWHTGGIPAALAASATGAALAELAATDG